jgi:hypothetical protein
VRKNEKSEIFVRSCEEIITQCTFIGNVTLRENRDEGD